MMGFLRKIVSGTSGGLVGGATGATLLTGIGFLLGGPVIGAISFGIGTVAGTTGGAIAGNELSKKVGESENG